MTPTKKQEPSEDISKSAREEADNIANETISKFKLRVEESGSSDRANLSEAVISDNFLKPIYDITQNWDKLIAETSTQLEITEGLNKKQAKEKAETYYVNLLKQRSSYMEGLAENKMGPNDSRVEIAKLFEMQEVSKEFTALLMEKPEEFKDLQDALLYVLGKSRAGKKAEAVSNTQRVAKIKQTLTDAFMNEFSGDKTKPKPKFSYAAAILSLADSTIRIDMLKAYLKTETRQENKKPVLEALNHLGAVSPLEMQALMNENNITASNEEIKKYAEGYDAKHNFTETAKAMAKDGYGSHNWLNDNFNLKGLGVFLGYLCGTVTIGANLIVNRKHIAHDPLSMMNNPYYLVGAGEIAFAKYLHSDVPMRETFATNDEEVKWKETKAKEALTLGLNSSPFGWKKFFEDDDKKGVEMFGNFIKDKQENAELQGGKFKLQYFKDYLDINKKNKTDDFWKMSEKIKNLKLEDDPLAADKFNKFAMAFLGLKLWGVNAKKKYHDLTKVV